MNFAAFTDASFVIQLHIVVAISAFLLGGYVLVRPKGDRLHRNLGKTWVALMATVALTSFFIHTIRMLGPFSPIHLVSIFVLYALFHAVRAARRRDIARHLGTMRQLYLFALIGAGAFTFLPGRLMNRLTLQGDAPWIGWMAIAVAGVFAGFVAWRAYPELKRKLRRFGNLRAS